MPKARGSRIQIEGRVVTSDEVIAILQDSVATKKKKAEEVLERAKIRASRKSDRLDKKRLRDEDVDENGKRIRRCSKCTAPLKGHARGKCKTMESVSESDSSDSEIDENLDEFDLEREDDPDGFGEDIFDDLTDMECQRYEE